MKKQGVDSGRWDLAIRLIAGSMCLAALFVVAYTLTGGWDVWWHMAVGRTALEQGTTFPADVFSASFQGSPWHYKDLLAGIAFYGGFEVLGYWWFAVLKFLSGAALLMAIAFSTPRDRAGIVASTAAGLLLLAAIQYRLVERPFLFSFALFGVLLFSLSRLRVVLNSGDVEAQLKRALVVVLVLWCWAQLHRGVLVGYGLVLAWVLEVMASLVLGRASRLAPWFGASPHPRSVLLVVGTFLVSLGLGALNPSGIQLFTSSMSMAGNDTMRRVVTDFSRIDPITFARDFPVVIALVITAMVTWTIARRRSEHAASSVLHPALILFFAVASVLDCVRWIPYLAIYSAWVTGVSSRLLLAGLVRSRFALFGFFLMGLACVLWLAANNTFGYGIGPMENRYPQGAVNYVGTKALKGPVVNSFALGGYAIWTMWPQVRVSVDGRNDIIYPPKYLERSIVAQVDESVFEGLSRELGATWVLAGNLPGLEDFTFLSKDPDWAMVYWSEEAVIHVLREDHPELSSDAYLYVDSRSIDGSVWGTMNSAGANPMIVAGLGKEVKRMLEASPKSLRANTAAAIYFHLRGSEYRDRRNSFLGVVKELDEDGNVYRELDKRLRGRGGPAEKDHI